MAENETDRVETSDESAGFHVNLGESSDATVFTESDENEAEVTDATESAQEAKTESAEGETFLGDDDKDIDLSSPEYKEAYKRLLKSYTKKIQAIQKDAPAPTAKAEPAQPAAAAQAPQGEWDPYTVPLEDYVYKGEPEAADAENSLAGFEESIDRRISEGVRRGIQYTLDQMRKNDGILRQHQQVGTAREQIEAFAAAIQSHPEYDDKAAALAEFASKPWSRQMAVEDPQAWIEAVESKFGIKRNWQDEATAENDERDQATQRLATKSRASVPRPTQTRAPALGSTVAGRMSAEDAFEKAWRESRH